MRLFLNPNNRAYLREMAGEFGASPGQLKEELKQLTQASILSSERVGRQIFYRANKKHSLFPELNSMVRKALGMDSIVDSIVRRLESMGESEIPSSVVGEMVMDGLRTIDDVAYVRFASVYRSFEDVNAFREEIERLQSRETADI